MFLTGYFVTRILTRSRGVTGCFIIVYTTVLLCMSYIRCCHNYDIADFWISSRCIKSFDVTCVMLVIFDSILVSSSSVLKAAVVTLVTTAAFDHMFSNDDV